MNTTDKRRPPSGSSSSTSASAPTSVSVSVSASNPAPTPTPTPNRNSMPAPPPRAAMIINAAVASGEEPLEGGVPLTDKDHPHHHHTIESRTGSIKDKDRDKDRSSRQQQQRRDKKDRDAAAAAASAALRERDERIAELEREMEIMEREFSLQLDKLSQNESETATFWQSKHSALHQQYLRVDTELRLLRTEVEVREGEREELREGWEVLRRELKKRDDEVRGLRGQVRGLKDFVSNNTRTEGQKCDETFGDAMAKLGNGLQNWVIVNFRKAKLNADNLDEETQTELSELVPMYEDLVSTAKVHLLQSIVSRILVDMVFNAYFVGLSEEQEKQFRDMEKLLTSYSSDEPVNQWRSSTLTILRRDSEVQLAEASAAVTEKVIARTARILDALAGTSPSEARDSGLRVLVNNSVELARLLVVQRAVLRVHMPVVLPHQRLLFEADTMEDLGCEDEDALATREISCVAFPGIIKHGDEYGGHLQYRNVLVKARVVCSPE